ncbi:MAG: Ni/Fe hydrogenase subunit alpha [Planctomycetaceae bacterium]|nr:Ni/Fe hydrogenase subunit alpha [Planctomycetaceae bacterium]
MSTVDTINVPILTRVEGEGALTIRLRDGQLDDVQLRIYEPPRLFEALLQGRPLEDAPDITARICGICPVAYQMSSVSALEDALDVTITPQIRQLRRLLYCGEWIESHALHVHLLHAPDFFDVPSGMELARRFPDEMRRGLRLKKHGNELIAAIGGRAIHPVNVAVGGFHRWPPRDELKRLIPDFEWGLQAAMDAARWVTGFHFPEFEQDYEFVALSHPDEYALNEGMIASNRHPAIAVEDYQQYFVERQVAHSTALQATRMPEGSTYLLGSLARINLNFAQLLPQTRQLADDIGFAVPCNNPFRMAIARCLEVVQAYEEALQILRVLDFNGPYRISYQARSAVGRAATEAPRGTLFHEYEIDAQGKIVRAVIIPPTSQNQSQIEADLRSLLQQQLIQGVARGQLATDAERLVRSYDPCISCATHFLQVRWEDIA